jgi:hypothetical protein
MERNDWIIVANNNASVCPVSSSQKSIGTSCLEQRELATEQRILRGSQRSRKRIIPTKCLCVHIARAGQTKLSFMSSSSELNANQSNVQVPPRPWRRRRRLGRLKSAASQLVQKINVGRWIDDLERDQELADKLEDANKEYRQEAARRELVATVKEECMNAVRVHLQNYLQSRCRYFETRDQTSLDSSTADTMTAAATNDASAAASSSISYEDWIAELHPDNYRADNGTIDARFYVPNSDHRLLWNEYVDTLQRGSGSSSGSSTVHSGDDCAHSLLACLQPVPARSMEVPGFER